MSQILPNPRILLVDDDPSNLRLLERILSSYGYKNTCAIRDPRQVKAEYRRERPDLILLDLNMPYMNGFDVIRELHGFDDPLQPPIVVLTADPRQSIVHEALNAGAQDYLSKPFDLGELRARVQNMLEIHAAHAILHSQKETLDRMVQEKTAELLHTRLQIVQRLAKAAEYRDNDTGHHIVRVSLSAVRLADELGWSTPDREMLLHAAPLHDVGKIGVPDSILLKPDQLDPHEWDVMKSHTTIGAEILYGDDSSLLRIAHEIALTHHERWDGTGYPGNLSGESIPVSGRIIAVVDVFDALTSERPYKAAWSIDRAIELIRTSAGTQFDPDVVHVFDRILPDIADIRSRYSESEKSSDQEPP